MQQIIALQINPRERERESLLSDLFRSGFYADHCTRDESPLNIWVVDRRRESSRVGRLPGRGVCFPGIPSTPRVERRKERNEGRKKGGKEKKWRWPLRGSWYLLVASGSLPQHCCGLSSRGGASQPSETRGDQVNATRRKRGRE